jgi:hypothetical protein
MMPGTGLGVTLIRVPLWQMVPVVLVRMGAGMVKQALVGMG